MPRRRPSTEPPSADPHVRRARTIADILDRKFVDPLLGLVVPGVGDIISSGLGLYLVGTAISRRLPLIVVARMLINLAVDTLVGAVPIVGDLFDFVFQANRRNLELLEARHRDRRSRPSDYVWVIGAVLLLLAALALPIWLAIAAVRWMC